MAGFDRHIMHYALSTDSNMYAHLNFTSETKYTQRVVYENETLRRELESQRRELKQKCKEIDKCEAELDIKSKQLSVLSEEVLILLFNLNSTVSLLGYKKAKYCAREYGWGEDMSSEKNVLTLTEVNDMCKKLEEKDYELDSLIDLNNTLIAKGLDGFAYIRSRPPVIGINRMGELNEKPFRDICIKKFSTTKWETKSAELCSLWQKKIQDSQWYPYKHVTTDEKLTLRELKDEWGKEVHDAGISKKEGKPA
ncbi:factor of DNA methylation 1-like [Papaver somniferum]|uniref:factor of DNA methylation 1-like n=1 Tax=Papaver somniferum TaxID=3469 RepID=UPI000E6F9221|nr:factor of DNA methylation 1-like [Papaver somniferum]